MMSQEKSFRRGASYVLTMVAEFDEYTNDWLYLREEDMVKASELQSSALVTAVNVDLNTANETKSTESRANHPIKDVATRC
ncbi:putative membrane protein [Hordeum vulgare]|nr:putative membrane protein [Hordeum vulgare]